METSIPNKRCNKMSTEKQAKAEFDIAIKNIEAEILEATKEADLKNEAYQVAQERNSIALREALVANQTLNAKHMIYRDLMVKAKNEKELKDAVQMALDERLRGSRTKNTDTTAE